MQQFRRRRTGRTGLYADRVFLGENLLPYLVLAFGGALFVGSALAIFIPDYTRIAG